MLRIAASRPGGTPGSPQTTLPAYNVCSAMASPERTVSRRPRFQDDARNFWHRVSEGLALNQLWSQFEKDARSSYRLYSAGLDDLQVQPSRIRRGWEITKALFWAILEKLTPARRVLLLAALILLFFPAGSSSYTDNAGHSEVHEFDLHVLGGAIMFVVLLLELAD